MGTRTRSRATMPVFIAIAATIAGALAVVLLLSTQKPDGDAAAGDKLAAFSSKHSVIGENSHTGASTSHESPVPNSPESPGNADSPDSSVPFKESADSAGNGAATASSGAPASLPTPTSPDVEPDNDIDAETGEPAITPSPEGTNVAPDTTVSGLPAPTDTPTAPDNDVRRNNACRAPGMCPPSHILQHAYTPDAHLRQEPRDVRPMQARASRGFRHYAPISSQRQRSPAKQQASTRTLPHPPSAATLSSP